MRAAGRSAKRQGGKHAGTQGEQGMARQESSMMRQAARAQETSPLPPFKGGKRPASASCLRGAKREKDFTTETLRTRRPKNSDFDGEERREEDSPRRHEGREGTALMAHRGKRITNALAFLCALCASVVQTCPDAAAQAAFNQPPATSHQPLSSEFMGRMPALPEAYAIRPADNTGGTPALPAGHQPPATGHAAAPAAFLADNPQQHFQARFDASGVQISATESDGSLTPEVSLRTVNVAGRTAAQSVAAPEVEGSTISYTDGGVREWFVNAENGLKHNIEIATPTDTGSLTVAVEVSGGVTPVLNSDGQSIDFVNEYGVGRTQYSGLQVFDATRRPLPATFDVEGQQVRIQVETANAIFPVTIDPLITRTSWSFFSPEIASVNRNVRHGGYVGSAGDLNGDGYDDFWVVAPNFDIVSPSNIDNVGIVYVFYGSPSGPSSAPDWTERGNQPQGKLGAMGCIPAGDYNGDGFGDLLILSPFYDNIGPDPDVFNAGQAKLIFGGPNGLPRPGDADYASRSFAFYGIAARDTLGWSAAAADINKDGKSDLVLGAPSYDYDVDGNPSSPGTNTSLTGGRLYVSLGQALTPGVAPALTKTELSFTHPSNAAASPWRRTCWCRKMCAHTQQALPRW